MKTYVLFITVVLNALSAGFFFSWSVSVILGTKKVSDFTYLETMQHINREILNPVFFIVFIGSLITLMITTFMYFNIKPIFWFVLASTIVYLIGTFGITAFGNVPLNNQLDALDIAKLSTLELKNFRGYYERSWNYYHNIRTVSGLISFILLLIATFIQKLF
ncbi:DUF1772 domain-containing protein [Aquimarina litoralis]|uniref:anthrone oxygenase family protein n=1 Tax=Aquimarina litoralis TaxID=584605 RepID=UPI001C57039B|nr:DUF1772 domain-containing protein [Aquimarina litoralis]MBW1295018.1 DUF1772 domain-containing protein [Aquimarina litoralis]